MIAATESMNTPINYLELSEVRSGRNDHMVAF